MGFVPTMGALHEGHLTLIRRCRKDCDVAVVSVFVNPTQFAAGEDLHRYPRDLNRDLQLASAEEVDALFAPSSEEMYPAGFQTSVEVRELGSSLEGASRPGHFAGVATVVTKLFNIVQPDRAYFGQKDYQQLMLIERLVRDLNMPVDVTLVPTVREPDGLAYSSRNSFLSAEERNAAPVLYKALQLAQKMVVEGERDPGAIRKAMHDLINGEPLIRVDYVALLHPETLVPVERLPDGVTLVALAAWVGRTRLIDNYFVAPQGTPIDKHRLNRG